MHENGCLFMKLMSAWKAKTFTEACRYGVLVVRTYLDDVWIRCLSVKSMRIKVTYFFNPVNLAVQLILRQVGPS
jgi:hypothetical protein